MGKFRRRVLSTFKIPEQNGHEISALQNPDLEPMEKGKRTWDVLSYAGFWGVPNVSISTWSAAGSLISLKLNFPYIMGLVVVTNLLLYAYILLNSSLGTKYHVGFAGNLREVFGIYGSIWGLLVRLFFALIKTGELSWLGGQALVLVFSSFSKNYLNMKNTLPPNIQTGTRDFIAYVCFFVLLFLCSFIKPEKLNIVVAVGCGTCSIAFFALLGICVGKNGGAGPMVHSHMSLSSSEIGWMWLNAMSSWYGGLSPLTMNANDFSRYARSEKKMAAGVFLGIMVAGTIVPLASLLCASATKGKYGEAMWMPTQIIIKFLEEDYSAGCRAGAFFAGLCFFASQVGFALECGAVAGGMNLAGMFPKYINVKRGTAITVIVSWIVQPWNFYNSDSTFETVMSSFGVFATPIIGISVADYWIVRRAKIPIKDFYTTSPEGTYYFLKGFNWRAFLVWILGVVPALPGLAKQKDSSLSIPSGLMHYFYGDLLFAFFCPLILYSAICYCFPVKNAAVMDSEDHFGVFTLDECSKLGMAPFEKAHAFLDYDAENPKSFDLQGMMKNKYQVKTEALEISSNV